MEENKAETSGGKKSGNAGNPPALNKKSEGELTGKPGLSRFTRNRAAA